MHSLFGLRKGWCTCPGCAPLVEAVRQAAVCEGVQGDQLHKAGAVKAFRSQLPRNNDFYGPEPCARGSAPPLPLQVHYPAQGTTPYPVSASTRPCLCRYPTRLYRTTLLPHLCEP